MTDKDRLRQLESALSSYKIRLLSYSRRVAAVKAGDAYGSAHFVVHTLAEYGVVAPTMQDVLTEEELAGSAGLVMCPMCLRTFTLDLVSWDGNEPMCKTCCSKWRRK